MSGVQSASSCQRLLAAGGLGDVEAALAQRHRVSSRLTSSSSTSSTSGGLAARSSARGRAGVIGGWLSSVSRLRTRRQHAAAFGVQRSKPVRPGRRPACWRSRLSISPQQRDSPSAPTLADDDFRVCATWRTPQVALRQRLCACASSRVSEVSKAAAPARRHCWPSGSSSRSRSSAPGPARTQAPPAGSGGRGSWQAWKWADDKEPWAPASPQMSRFARRPPP